MPTEAVTGFWSYAHEDNKLDGGAILKLAHLLEQEYNLIAGEPLHLFIDQDSVAWGDEWRSRINSALVETTFFIPIITPRYFMRPECRRELLEFAAKAKSLGVEELLLPILYVKPQDFSTENSDEAIALIARTQHVDWRATRLQELDSREYRKAVNALANRLLEVARNVAQNQFDREMSADIEANEANGIVDIMQEIMKLLPDWLGAVSGDKVTNAQIHATWHQVFGDVQKLQKAHAPASAILAAQTRATREMLPLIERYQREGQIYLTRSAQLDPLVSALARQVAEHPESAALAAPVREAIDEAMSVIRRGERRRKADPRAHPIIDHFAEMRHLGRIFQKSYAIYSEAGRLANEGNTIVRRWDAELGTSSTSSPSEAVTDDIA